MASNGSLKNVGGASGSGQKFGLILRGKKAPSQPQASKPSTSGTTSFSLGRRLKPNQAFASNDDSDEEEHQDEPITEASSIHIEERRRVNQELRTVQAQRSRLAEEEYKKALEEDPNVFDYDAVYDDLKKAEQQKKKSKDNPDGGVLKKPRYMEALLKNAAKRKIELERVELRKVQREREQEGDEFGDKEKFVTGAYKQHLEELKKIEEEEKRREEMEKDVTKGGDMTNFYKGILRQTERELVIPNAVQANALEGNLDNDEDDNEEVKKRKNEAIRKGLVAVNDSEEVVDKRQLLSGGLNLTSKSVKRHEEERRERERQARELAEKKAAEERTRHLERESMRKQQERARALVEEQQRQKEEDDRKRKEREDEELARKMARQASDATISDAKARYLARKKAQQQQPQKDDSDSDS
ncbi:hypothetical protein HDU85_007382 [Gaertneriomyces sp. JEL0708]|nr:hypothetical protein HDU85_007382 [Gaertneriomyces sp. JEL0708]